MKNFFGGKRNSSKISSNLSKIKAPATSLLVAFLILSFPLQSFADVVVSADTTTQSAQNIQVTTADGKTPVSNQSISTLPADATKTSVQNLKTDPQDKKTQTKSVQAASNNVVLRAASAAQSSGGESSAATEDVSAVRSGGSKSNQSGAFEYSYPIDVPPGRNGLTPEVSLNYSSNDTNITSPFGFGWSIGIPKIERLNLTGTNKLYTDNNFTSSLDGQLVAVSSTTYRAKIESGSFNSYTYMNGVWTIFDKKGVKYTFGSTTASRQENASNTTQVAIWMLDEVLDKNGEKITYTYFKNTGQIYPDTISYAFNSGTPIYTVKFLRTTLSSASPNLVHSQFSKGFEEKRGSVVGSIQVLVNNVLVSKTDSTYVYSPNSSTHLRRSAIAMSSFADNGATTTLPTVTFTYTSDTSPTFIANNIWSSSTPKDLYSQFRSATTSTSSPGLLTGTFYRTSIIDMNGDGLSDWVNNGDVYMNTGASWNATATWSGLPVSFDGSYRLVDINGDGLPDRIKAKDFMFHPSLGQTNYKEVEFLFNQGDGTWVTNSAWSTTTPLLFYTETTSATGSKTFTSYRNYFSDMNGDGLVDWIYAGNVYMNTGNGFTSTPTWTGLPGNFETLDRLEDVNGDSLPDIVRAYKKTFNPAYSSTSPVIDYSVKLNRGDGTWQTNAAWAASIPAPVYEEYQVSATVIQATSTSVYLIDMGGDSLPEWLAGTKIYKNIGTSWATTSQNILYNTDTFTRDVRLTDVNGDLVPDYILSSTQSWDASYNLPNIVTRAVQLNTAKKTWLLATTTNELGGTTEVVYTPSTFPKNGTIQNPNSPYVLYTVTSLTTDPKISPKQTTTYEYTGGDLYHNPTDVFSRRYAGFAVVTEISDLGKTKTYYHQGNSIASASFETPDDFAKIGLPYRTEITSLNDNLFKTQISCYATSSLGNGATYVRPDRETSLDYDGDSDHIDTATEYVFNTSNGTILTKTNWGKVNANTDGTFIDMSGDKRTTTYTYASNIGSNIIALLSGETSRNESNATTSDTRYYYDVQALGSVLKGNLTKNEAWASSSAYVNTQSAYNALGLKTSDTDPRGFNTTYSYDTANLYPATTTNSLGQSTRFTYDYTSGKPKTITDVNNLTKSFVYDGLDRVLEEQVPDPVTGVSVTKTKYVYTDIASSTSVKASNYLSSTTIQDAYSYVDGFGREIQTRVGAEVPGQFVVKDSIYGSNGLLIKSSLPYFGTGIARSIATTTSSLFNTIGYDALGRVASTTNVTGTTFLTYDQWITTEKNVLGKDKDTTVDAYGRLIKVVENNGTSTYSTNYEWNNNDNLTKITDALGNVRNFTYDNLGRRLTAEDLHAPADSTFGIWSYGYDSAGNLTTKTDPKGQVVQYTYDNLSRPLTENFTGTAGIEVTNVYDSCTRGVGQLCLTTNNVSTTSYAYAYNLLPQTETKTIGTSTFATSYTYDRLGNQTQIVYPDLSEVRNSYNAGNYLERVEQKENSGAWRDIVTSYDYHPTGQVSYQVNGNGTKTIKVYNPSDLYRLRSIVTTASSTTGTGGPGEALREIEALLNEPTANPESLLLSDTPVDIPLATTSDSVIAISSVIENTLSTTTQISSTTDQISTTTKPKETFFGIGTTSSEIIPFNPEVLASTSQSTPLVVIEEIITKKVKPLDTKNFIKNVHDAQTWQKFHKERLAGIERELGTDSKAYIAALQAQDDFEQQLIQEKYLNEKGGKIDGSNLDWVRKGIKKSVAEIFSYVLPSTAFAYFFGTEDFENCSTLPCSFNNNLAWGGAAPSLDATSQVNGIDSLKETVTSEGGGALEYINLNRDEIYAKFNVFIPSTMTWGAAGYFNTIQFEDVNNNIVFWLSVEDWGSARLTMHGDVLPWTDTGLNLTKGAVNTIQVRFKKGTTNGDVDIWLNNTNQSSPNYNGSGTLDTGTDNVDDILAGVTYAPNAISTTYYDDIAFDPMFIGQGGSNPVTPFAANVQNLAYTYDAVGNIIQIVDTSDTVGKNTTVYQYDDLYRLTRASTTVATTSPYLQTYVYNAVGNITNKSDIGAYSYTGAATTLTSNIYTDSLAVTWDNWSWGGTYDPASTAQVFSGTSALKATYTSQYGGLQLRNGTLNTTGFTSLDFKMYIESGTSTSFYINTYNKDTNAQLGQVAVNTYISGGANTTGQWHTVSIPLTALGLSNFTGNGAFVIQSDGLPNVVVYYDDIKFVGTNSGGNTVNYTNPHAPVSINGITQSYDQNGNLASTSAGLLNTWSYDNRLLSTTIGSSTGTYQYDSAGSRIKKTVGCRMTRY